MIETYLGYQNNNRVRDNNMSHIMLKKRHKMPRLVKRMAIALHQFHRIDFITSNLVALAFCGIVAILLQYQWLLPHPPEYHYFFMVGLSLLASQQVVKSAHHSLLLPTLCLLIGCLCTFSHHFYHTNLLSINVAHALVLIGAIGTCVSVFRID